MKYKITIGKRVVILSEDQLYNLKRAIQASNLFGFSITKETVGDVTVEPVR
jgi:hypothetical protein